jgi:pilus assembly protein CpaF
MGTFDAAAERLLRAVVAARLALLVVGGTGSGNPRPEYDTLSG